MKSIRSGAEERIWGRRAILEAFEAEKRRFSKILLLRGGKGETFREIAELAGKRGISVEECDRKRLDRTAGTEDHQGVIALVSALAPLHPTALLDHSTRLGEPPFILAVDQISDPQNLGAIIRTAEVAGLHGLLMSERNTAPLHGATAKASAGALEHLLVSRVSNLGQGLARLREAGLRLIAAEPTGNSRLVFDADLTGPLAIIFGSEGKGLSGPIRARCDESVSIPMRGRIQSLNVSAAAAVILFEALRQRTRS